MLENDESQDRKNLPFQKGSKRIEKMAENMDKNRTTVKNIKIN
jgi:hypothetical protein